MSKIPFGHMATTVDEQEYVGDIGKRRRSQQCQCDSGLTHGTCPGPENCPNSDRNEEDEIRFLASIGKKHPGSDCSLCGFRLSVVCGEPLCPLFVK